RAMSPGDNDHTKWSFAFIERPLFRQKPNDGFWYVYLPESKTVYCNFRSYDHIAANTQGLFKLINEQHPDKLVVDMRQNGGGDYNMGLKHL
ncbi:hypothetical protein Q8G81_33355, partial [Klebsiella pneumoniae]